MDIDELMKMLAEGEGMVDKEAPRATPKVTPPEFKPAFKVPEVPIEALKDFEISSAPEVAKKFGGTSAMGSSAMSIYPLLMAAAAHESKKAMDQDPQQALSRTEDERYGTLADASEGIREYLKGLLGDRKAEVPEVKIKVEAQDPTEEAFAHIKSKADTKSIERALDKASINKVKIPSAHEPYAEFMPKGNISEVGAKELVPTSIEELKSMVKKLEGKKS